MYTSPPVTGFIILSVVGILMLATVPLVALTLYGEPVIAQPAADPNGAQPANAG